ncbi:MAG TPA: hypothetical protein VFN55_14665 [Solirubrobacteraceae bacterium]|nr:hypothetical protein [Solirubrobacteraceae bacterium]
MSQLQDQIDRGEYRVDAHAVADAIIRRLVAERRVTARDGDPPQSKCS